MAWDAQGTIYIPLEEFYAFVKRFHPHFDENYLHYGNIRVTSVDIEIDYAAATDNDPADWVEPPDFLKKKG